MKLTSISIFNYRGVRDKQIIPISNFTSIVGKNDAGKSIVVNAIASFLDPKSYKFVESDFNKLDEEIIIEGTFFDEKIYGLLADNIKSKIKKEDGLDEFLDDIISENQIVVQKVVKKIGSDCVTNLLITDYTDENFKNLYAKSDDEITQVLNNFSIDIPVSGTGRNSKLEKIKHIKAYCEQNSISTEKVWIEDIYKISSLLPDVELFVSDYGLEADTKFKSNSVSEMKSFFENETADETKRLSQIEKDIQREMNKEANSIKKYMSEYTSSLQEVLISPDINWEKAIQGVNVKFRFDGDSFPIIMSHKGSGYRRLFMVARFRYLAEKRKSSDIVYLIEEPETFLHPSAQEDLLNALKALSVDNQIIITTHSPVFVGATEEESVVLCIKNGQSEYRTTNNSGDRQAFIIDVIGELGVKPHYNLRDKFEKVLFVEGEDDCYFYNKVSENLLGKSLLDNERILVLPCGGSSINSFINIRYFDDQTRQMYLILDSDKGVKHNPSQAALQKKKYEEFNRKNNCHAYLLKKSNIENYFHPRAVEKLLSLPENTLDMFSDDAFMKDVILNICATHGVNFGKKSNRRIFDLMTKEEYEEIIEDELVEFVKEVLY